MEQELLKTDDISKKLLSKWFWVYFFLFLTAPIGYVLRMVLSKTISVEEVGMFYTAFWLINILCSYNDLWLTEALQYFIPKYRIAGEKDKIKWNICVSFFMQMFSWILIFCALYFWAEWISLNHMNTLEAVPVFKMLSFYFLWYNILQLCSVIFISFQDTFSQGAVDFVKQLGALTFTLIYRGSNALSPTTYATSRILWVVLWILLWVFLLGKKYYKLFKKVSFPQTLLEKKTILKIHFSYALIVFLTTNIGTVLWQVDLQIVNNKLWNINAWYFTNFQSLINIFSLIANSLIVLVFPLTTELISRNEEEKFKTMKTILYSYFWVFSLFMSGFFILLGKEFATLLFSPEYITSWTLLQIVAPFFIFSSRCSISYAILAWLWQVKKRFLLIALSLIINLILNYFIIIRWWGSIEHSGLIIGLTWIFMGVSWFRVIQHFGKFPIKRGLLIKNFLLIGAVTWGLYYYKQFMPFHESAWKDWLLIWLISIFYFIVIFLWNLQQVKQLKEELKKFKK